MPFTRYVSFLMGCFYAAPCMARVRPDPYLGLGYILFAFATDCSIGHTKSECIYMYIRVYSFVCIQERIYVIRPKLQIRLSTYIRQDRELCGFV